MAAVIVAPVAAQAATLEVVPVGHGSVTYTPSATAAAGESAACTVSGTSGTRTDLTGKCVLTYAAGTVVTLSATGGPADGDGGATAFRRWSDEGCPGSGSCTVTVDAEPRSVAALFAPQRVSVLVAGTAGKVDSAPEGLTGGLQANVCDLALLVTECHDDFDPDLGIPVQLTATGGEWLANAPQRAVVCDPPGPVDPVCNVTPLWPRWASVGFGVTPTPDFPPDVQVNFRVAKVGNGSGTVRSASLDCGTKCAFQASFGVTEALVAEPDRGSNFDGWRTACGNAPTCRLAIGPVTSVTAVFQRGAAGSTRPGQRPRPGSRPGRRAFAARVLSMRVRGKGRRRVLIIRVRTNAAATVRAQLMRGRRPVASRRWRVRSGTHLLRMRIPARARSGTYRVRLTFRRGDQVVRVNRAVSLRR